MIEAAVVTVTNNISVRYLSSVNDSTFYCCCVSKNGIPLCVTYIYKYKRKHTPFHHIHYFYLHIALLQRKKEAGKNNRRNRHHRRIENSTRIKTIAQWARRRIKRRTKIIIKRIQSQSGHWLRRMPNRFEASQKFCMENRNHSSNRYRRRIVSISIGHHKLTEYDYFVPTTRIRRFCRMPSPIMPVPEPTHGIVCHPGCTKYGIRNPGIYRRINTRQNVFATMFVIALETRVVLFRFRPWRRWVNCTRLPPPQISASRRRRAHTTHDVLVLFPCLHPRASMMS